MTELKFKLACKGVLIKLHTFSIDGLTKTVLTVYQKSMLVWNTIHQLIKFKEVIKKGRFHGFFLIQYRKVPFNLRSFNVIDID
jgi:hypothetical protein